MEIRATKRIPPKRFPLSWFILRGVLLLVVLVGRLLYICDSNKERILAIGTDGTWYAFGEIRKNYRKMYRKSPLMAKRFLMSLSLEELYIVMEAIESQNE